MLYPAILYKDELLQKYANISHTDYMKYYEGPYTSYEIKLEDSTWGKLQIVGIDEDDMYGYYSATIDRTTGVCTAISAINFSQKKIKFGLGVVKFIEKIFDQGMHKIEFKVCNSNPIKPSYDKYVELYGGNIVGILHQTWKLTDGSMHDETIYELFKNKYFEKRCGYASSTL